MRQAATQGDMQVVNEIVAQIASLAAGDAQIDQPDESAPMLSNAASDLRRGIGDSIALMCSVERAAAVDLARQESGASSLVANEIEEMIRGLGLRRLELVKDLPIILTAFGFSRRAFTPTYEERNAQLPTHLNHFGALDRDAARSLMQQSLVGRIPLLAREGKHEGLFLALDPELVLGWLAANNVQLPSAGDQAIVGMMQALEEVDRFYDLVWELPVRRLVYGLVHSLSHAAMRSIARLAGLERTSVAEYVFLPLLGTVIYVAGSALNLGHLDLMARAHLHEFLSDLATEAVICPMDPDCIDHDGACAMCLQSPDISCRTFNHGLSRALLRGGHVPWLSASNDTQIVGFWEYVANRSTA
jgi:hypothetical protein